MQKEQLVNEEVPQEEPAPDFQVIDVDGCMSSVGVMGGSSLDTNISTSEKE